MNGSQTPKRQASSWLWPSRLRDPSLPLGLKFAMPGNPALSMPELAELSGPRISVSVAELKLRLRFYRWTPHDPL